MFKLSNRPLGGKLMFFVSILLFPALVQAQQLCITVDPPNPNVGDIITVVVYLDAPSPPVGAGCGPGLLFDYLGPFPCGTGDFVGVVSGTVGINHDGAGQLIHISSRVGGSLPINFPASTNTLPSFASTIGNVEHRRIVFFTPVPPPELAIGLDFIGGPVTIAGNVGALATFQYRVNLPFDRITFAIDADNTTLEWGTNNPGNFLCSLESAFPSGTFAVVPPPLVTGGAVTVGTPSVGSVSLSGTVKYYDHASGGVSNGVPNVVLNLDTNPPTGFFPPVVSNATDGTYSFAGLAAGTSYQLGGRGIFRADLYEEGVQRRDPPSAYLLTNNTDISATPAINGTDVGAIMLHWTNPSAMPLLDHAFNSPCSGERVFPQKVAANVNAWQVSEDCRFLTGFPDPDALSITGLDAAILQQVISARLLGVAAMPFGYPFSVSTPGIGTPPGCADNWVFFDANCQLFMDGNNIQYDPIGVLIGDVVPSYQNTSLTGKPSMMPGTKLVVEKVSTTDARVIVPVELRDADDMLGLEARIVFDSSVLRFVEASAPIDPATGSPSNHVYGQALNGTLALIVTALTERLDGTATVALLEFERVDPSASEATSPILVTNGLADDMLLETENGFFTTSSVEETSWGTVKNLYR